MSKTWVVAALYRFAPIEDPRALRAPLLELCQAHGLVGVLLLAPEGVNGTVAGTASGVEALLQRLRQLPGFAELEAKWSESDVPPYYRMRIRIKPEIVTMGKGDLDPRRSAGVYVEPEAWNALLDDPKVVLVDTRNDYEVRAGTFEGAIDPALPNFRGFPAWAAEHLEPYKQTDKKIAMFCTGGIRCEKASAWLREAGFREVYHLRGGILRYMERVAESESKWRGECFVFDDRVTVTHALERGSYALCYGCKAPVAPQEMASADFEAGVTCARCASSVAPEVRASRRERMRQLQLASERGTLHLGATMPTSPAPAPRPRASAVLYSFRRCPYAIRARMALAVAGQNPEIREIDLRNKPAPMLAASARGTVPVLVFEDGRALEESLDIMDWALRQHDPEAWLSTREDPELQQLLRDNDGPFKRALDRYKYPERYEGASRTGARAAAGEHLVRIEQRLQRAVFLGGTRLGFYDAALFPFVRQFAGVEPEWFASAPFPHVRAWRDQMLMAPAFARVMGKLRPWKPGDEALGFLDTLDLEGREN